MRRVALLALGLAGCGDGDERPAPPMLSGPTALEECPEVDFNPCNIERGSCRKRLFAVACCVFGCDDDTPSLPVEQIDKEQWRARLLDTAESSSNEASSLETVLVALDLTSSGSFSVDAMVDHSVDNVLGYYDHDSKTITIIEQDEADELEASTILVHEAVHALQDREHDLAGLHERVESIDESLALSSVVEGEARFLEYRALIAMQGLDESEVDLALATQSDRLFSDQWMLEQADRYQQSLGVLRYSYGADAARAVWQNDGRRGLRAALRAPPRSTLSLFEAIFGAEPSDPDRLMFMDPLALEPDEATLLWSGRFGPWLVYLMTRVDGVDVTDAASVALSFRGDLLESFALPTGELVWRWDFVFEEQSARDILRDALALRPVTLHVPSETVLSMTNRGAPEWSSRARAE